ncbi:MAG: hypothetical protein Dasosvirus9_3 [Dasosvirus sp.]|uniref:ASCH domain-containing protein n=1 Tax=Dasosvirus sp. TaxID=2487764 RepID=A0A3G4ZVV6_9VIRU|nr:MAG: hypothetical protein Dasosvirus9_3 [Dasosvirus sp.]
MITLWVRDPSLSYIMQGTKTVEGRLLKPIFDQIKKGDTICFNNMFTKKVKYVKIYSSFDEMLCSEKISRVMPMIDNHQVAVKKYHEIYRNKIGVYKVIAICLI